MAIYQDLVSDHGFAARYNSVRLFTIKLRGQETPEPHPVITTEPGQEAQVDYGEGPMVRQAQTGKYRRSRLFVFTLGYSRKSVRLLTMRSSSQIWAELHERAFQRLGGVPKTVVLDNLREGVIKADYYDPTLNPLYRDVLKHYGVTALPCRPYLNRTARGRWNRASDMRSARRSRGCASRRSKPRRHTSIAGK